MNEQALEITEKPELPMATLTNEAPIIPAKQDAAQARIEHVAGLLSGAYQKASTLVLTPEEIAKLSAPFEDADICTGAGGDPNLLYLQHSSIRRRLASVFSPGQWALINRRTWLDESQGYMYSDCVLIIRGCYVGEAIGAQRWNPKNARMNYSDAVEGSQSEALRRIAGKYLDCGVQLWDKHYCEAWKARQNKRPATLTPPTKQNVPNPIVARSEPSPSPGIVTEAHKNRLIEILAPLGAAALEYCQKAAMLMPTETLEDLPLRFVPATKEQKDAFMACVQAFVDGGSAEKPAYVLEDDRIPMDFPPKDEPAKAIDRMEQKAKEDIFEPWRSFPMPFGKQAGIRLGDLPKKYLFGLWANFKVETEYNGKPKKPETIQKDTVFRQMLDDAGQHYEFTRPEDGEVTP